MYKIYLTPQKPSLALPLIGECGGNFEIINETNVSLWILFPRQKIRKFYETFSQLLVVKTVKFSAMVQAYHMTNRNRTYFK